MLNVHFEVGQRSVLFWLVLEDGRVCYGMSAIPFSFCVICGAFHTLHKHEFLDGPMARILVSKMYATTFFNTLFRVVLHVETGALFNSAMDAFAFSFFYPTKIR